MKCIVYNNYDQLSLPTSYKNKQVFQVNVSYKVTFDKQDLDKLEQKLVQLSKQISTSELKQTRLTLDGTQNMLSQIATHKRLKNWKETTIKHLQYAGYAAIASVIIFAMIRCGFFEFFSNCIPNKNMFIQCKN